MLYYKWKNTDTLKSDNYFDDVKPKLFFTEAQVRAVKAYHERHRD